MAIGGISTNISQIAVSTGTSSCSSISEQSSSSQSNESSELSFASVLNQISLNKEGQTYLIRHTGNIGSTIDIKLDDNGKMNLTVNELCDAFKAQSYVDIRSSDLNPAGQKYQIAHKCESIA